MPEQFHSLDRIMPEFTDILSDDVAILRGGTTYCQWVNGCLQACLRPFRVYLGGGEVIPQLGEEAGTPISFQCRSEEIPESFVLNSELIPGYWGEAIVDTKNIPIQTKDGNVSFSVAKTHITHGFDRPIGYLWAAVQPDQFDRLSIFVETAARLIGQKVLATKSSQALSYLAKPVWKTASNPKEAAQEVAENCRHALCCSAVVIWEADLREGILNTIAADGAEPVFDMPIGEGLAGQCATDTEILVVDDLLDDETLNYQGFNSLKHRRIVEEKGWRSAIFIPLDTGTNIAGVMGIYAQRPRGLSAVEKDISTAFAQRLSAGYVHTKRHEVLCEYQKRLEKIAPVVETGILLVERAHDIRNKLLWTRNSVNHLLEAVPSESNSKANIYAKEVAQRVQEVSEIVSALVYSSKLHHSYMKPTQLKHLLDNVQRPYEDELKRNGIKYTSHCPDDVKVNVDAGHIERVFLNLFSNSVYFLNLSTRGDMKKITVSVESEEAKGQVVIRFWDNGKGIAPNDKPKVFDHFFTTRAIEGLGFGLAIAKRIIEDHGGTISVESDWGRWTEFRIVLPTVTSRAFEKKRS